ncbi:unnamed protein product [Rotaria sordida]|uniref:Secernin-3 n=3 Tax=Rotaria sordida TaxID=392033 RepID=A0A814ZFT8_9BILA|nr:unnamed protein product [Rotaria sordida]CAF1247148.1 unnamed protein product [Rotaria sordida]CAF1417314.1 unnamed protein product [Rotaria sordida]CAF3618328.1 unnamed protein product [Rotaria sordida]CAF3918346.1 unnamed protein product [Rotaria sordida]
MTNKSIARSCDTFVVLPPLTDSTFHIFGKNSDRPASEVQEIIFVSKEHTTENKDHVHCTHIQVPQASTTYRCILSKPAWCWGAEMGANEHGVCIGNEAVFSKIAYHTRDMALTGLDIVRLALERAKTAKLAVEIIGDLVVKYGQGGTCYNPTAGFSSGYDNSFLVVDSDEAWVVETCDRVWVAKQIKEGYYNISNIYTIEDDYTIQSNNLETFAKDKKLWNGKEKLNFAETFQTSSACGHSRLKAGQKLLENLTKNGNFSVFDMISILRDDQSGICMLGDGDDCITTASQVSVLLPTNKKTSQLNACHFFTGTPNPKTSLFKPFIFTDKVELGPLTVSTPVEITSHRIHPLYSARQKASREQLEDKRLKDFEHEGIIEIIGKLKSSSNENNADTFDTLFHDTVSAEIELLREHLPTKHS